MNNYNAVCNAVSLLSSTAESLEKKAMDVLREIHDIEPIECVSSFYFDRIELDCDGPIAVFIGEDRYENYRTLYENCPLEILYFDEKKEQYLEQLRENRRKYIEAIRIKKQQKLDAETMKEYEQFKLLKAKFENDSEKSL